ncbi:hypothetical protein MIZ03_3897 [Rhodoferax lithotrophicus]|jgi:hypothetical protein|uniref:PepSY domain-containing protein n=1 Tax=Rhodoferax lithotrophicus TaxID=2798804 RepID=A0ABM7MRM6_9BURK|nr:PepSY domain-containing protein [Rhodoferax sp. MIZ03]BCO28987.1 hypothetical protein MIZ03_3897 [Rhodoferax sp. MIZ03]
MKIRLTLITSLLMLSTELLTPQLALAQPRTAVRPVAESSAPATDSYNRFMNTQICTTAPRSEWLPEDEMKLLATHRGYRIKTFRSDKNNCYEIYGFNQANQIVEAYFDPVTSRLLHQNIAQ